MKPFIDDLISRYPILNEIRSQMETAIGQVIACFERGNTLFCCGNGGSGSDADHIAGELLKGFILRRELPESELTRFESQFGADGRTLAGQLQRGLRCISLLSHPAFITAFCNDVNPDLIYAQQLYALARPGDLIIGISASGNAANVGYAFRVAKMNRIGSILLTGAKNGKCVALANLTVPVPATETFKIQELHLPFYHTLCMAVEDCFFGKRRNNERL